MADIKGTNIASGIAPFTDADKYPTHHAKYGKGGYKSVATITERDAIPTSRLEEGCVCYVTGTKKEYRWTNSAWVEITIGGGAMPFSVVNETATAIPSTYDCGTIFLKIGKYVDLDNNVQDMTPNAIYMGIGNSYENKLYRYEQINSVQMSPKPPLDNTDDESEIDYVPDWGVNQPDWWTPILGEKDSLLENYSGGFRNLIRIVDEKTLREASTTQNGLMSAADKAKFNNIDSDISDTKFLYEMMVGNGNASSAYALNYSEEKGYYINAVLREFGQFSDGGNISLHNSQAVSIAINDSSEGIDSDEIEASEGITIRFKYTDTEGQEFYSKTYSFSGVDTIKKDFAYLYQFKQSDSTFQYMTIADLRETLADLLRKHNNLYSLSEWESGVLYNKGSLVYIDGKLYQFQSSYSGDTSPVGVQSVVKETDILSAINELLAGTSGTASMRIERINLYISKTDGNIKPEFISHPVTLTIKCDAQVDYTVTLNGNDIPAEDGRVHNFSCWYANNRCECYLEITYGNNYEISVTDISNYRTPLKIKRLAGVQQRTLSMSYSHLISYSSENITFICPKYTVDTDTIEVEALGIDDAKARYTEYGMDFETECPGIYIPYSTTMQGISGGFFILRWWEHDAQAVLDFDKFPDYTLQPVNTTTRYSPDGFYALDNARKDPANANFKSISRRAMKWSEMVANTSSSNTTFTDVRCTNVADCVNKGLYSGMACTQKIVEDIWVNDIEFNRTQCRFPAAVSCYFTKFDWTFSITGYGQKTIKFRGFLPSIVELNSIGNENSRYTSYYNAFAMSSGLGIGDAPVLNSGQFRSSNEFNDTNAWNLYNGVPNNNNKSLINYYVVPFFDLQ